MEAGVGGEYNQGVSTILAHKCLSSPQFQPFTRSSHEENSADREVRSA